MRIPSGIRGVLVDTSAWYALEDSRDQWHSDARAIRDRIAAEGRWRLVTTNFVVAESHARILSRSRTAAARFLERTDSLGAVDVVRIEVEDEVRAREILRRYHDKDFSLVDALSFAVMDRTRIRHAFAFNTYFHQYGRFTVLTPSGAW